LVKKIEGILGVNYSTFHSKNPRGGQKHRTAGNALRKFHLRALIHKLSSQPCDCGLWYKLKSNIAIYDIIIFIRATKYVGVIQLLKSIIQYFRPQGTECLVQLKHKQRSRLKHSVLGFY
jgi:hypothetical protein